MKKMTYMIPVFALAGLIGVGSLTAYAAGNDWSLGLGKFDTSRWEQRLTSEASLLGITLDEMKSFWSQGKSVKEIATEKGISETDLASKMKAQRIEMMKTHLATLVSEDKLTQTQADARLKAAESKNLDDFGGSGGKGCGCGGGKGPLGAAKAPAGNQSN
jgi:hypothetical protein